MKGTHLLATILVMVTLGVQCQAATVTRNIVGTVSSTFGGGADVGLGNISGYFEFDSDMPLAPDIFELTVFQLQFSNGPTVSNLDDPFAQIGLNPESGELANVTLLAFGLNAFGLSSIDLQFEAFTTNFFFSNSIGEEVAHGSIEFQAVPLPMMAPLLVFSLAVIGRFRRSCSAYS